MSSPILPSSSTPALAVSTAASPGTLPNTQRSPIIKAVSNIPTPQLLAVLASSATMVAPAVVTYLNQPEQMSKTEMEPYLPKPGDTLGNMSTIMIHNAGTDTLRSDTLFVFSNQQQSTVDLLDSLPVSGAQMDPYRHGDHWVIRHVLADGSKPLGFLDELKNVNEWLDQHPDRVFVLDLDTFGRVGKNDTSLSEAVKLAFGDKLLLGSQNWSSKLLPSLSYNEHTKLRRLLNDGKQVFLSKRTAALAGFHDVDRNLTVSPHTTHANDLTAVHFLTRGIGPVDDITFASTPGATPSHIETPADIARHIQEPDTAVVLDQLSRSSFISPKGLESDPVYGLFSGETKAMRAVALAITTGAATAGFFGTLAVARQDFNNLTKQIRILEARATGATPAEKRQLQIRAGLSGLSTTAGVGNAALTFATVFPGLQTVFGSIGVGGIGVGLLATTLGVYKTGTAVDSVPSSTPSRPAKLYPDIAADLEMGRAMPQTQTANPVVEHSNNPFRSVANLLTGVQVLTRFASLAKYQIPNVVPAVAGFNLALSAAKASIAGMSHHQMVQGFVADPAQAIDHYQQQLVQQKKYRLWGDSPFTQHLANHAKTDGGKAQLKAISATAEQLESGQKILGLLTEGSGEFLQRELKAFLNTLPEQDLQQLKTHVEYKSSAWSNYRHGKVGSLVAALECCTQDWNASDANHAQEAAVALNDFWNALDTQYQQKNQGVAFRTDFESRNNARVDYLSKQFSQVVNELTDQNVLRYIQKNPKQIPSWLMPCVQEYKNLSAEERAVKGNLETVMQNAIATYYGSKIELVVQAMQGVGQGLDPQKAQLKTEKMKAKLTEAQERELPIEQLAQAYYDIKKTQKNQALNDMLPKAQHAFAKHQMRGDIRSQGFVSTAALAGMIGTMGITLPAVSGAITLAAVAEVLVGGLSTEAMARIQSNRLPKTE